MKNRIDAHSAVSFSADLGRDFASYPLYAKLNSFVGSINLQQYVQEHIEEKISKARQEGFEKATKEIVATVISEMNGYVETITNIADYVYEKHKEIDSTLEIVETKTNFFFGTQVIRILFIISTSFENELKMAKFLSETERDVFVQTGRICELLYINKQENVLDEESIASDFSLVRKREKK